MVDEEDAEFMPETGAELDDDELLAGVERDSDSNDGVYCH